jgi:hypothetical protein
MSELELHVVPRDLYYHEVAYVRGLEAEIERLRSLLVEAREVVRPFAGAVIERPDPLAPMNYAIYATIEEVHRAVELVKKLEGPE